MKDTAPKITVKTSDLVRAIRIAEQFKISAGCDRDSRINAVLSWAIDLTGAIAPHLSAGKRIDVGNVHGIESGLNKGTASQWAVRQDIGDDLMGRQKWGLSAPDRAGLGKVRSAFALAGEADALSLSVRTYGWVMEHVWRGNGLILLNGQKQEDLPFDIETFHEQARKAHQSRSIG